MDEIERRKEIERRRKRRRVKKSRMPKILTISTVIVLAVYAGKGLFDEHAKLHEFDDSLDKFTVSADAGAEADTTEEINIDVEVDRVVNNPSSVNETTQTETTDVDYEFPETYDVPKADDSKSYELLDAGYTDLVLDWEGIKEE